MTGYEKKAPHKGRLRLVSKLSLDTQHLHLCAHLPWRAHNPGGLRQGCQGVQVVRYETGVW